MIEDIKELYTQLEEERQAPSESHPSGTDSEKKAHLICETAEEFKARDITLLDVRGQTIIADFFVMCSGTSTIHIQSIAEGVREKLRESAHLRAKPEGEAGSFWVVLDFGDIILHVFDEATREFYDLERLWADAKIARWENGRAVPVAAAVQEESAGE